MAFTFTPRTENEIAALNLLQPGEGNFEVISADDERKSKKGNAMVELQLKVWDMAGKEKIIYDYLVDIESMQFKIRHFCLAVGLDYEAGAFSASDCLHKTGKLKIGVQKDKTGQYPDKNVVVDYLEVKTDSNKPQTVDDFFKDDDLTF